MIRRLEGARVLVTRPRERSRPLCSLLEQEGAHVISVPLLELLPPDDASALESAAREVHRYHWIVFASPSAVHALVDAVRRAGTFPALQQARIAVIGPATAQALREQGLALEREAESSTGAGLFEALRDAIAAKDEVLLPAAQEGRHELHEALEAAGANVTRIAAYQSTKKTLDPGLAEIIGAPPDAVMFASPRTADAFLEALGDRGRKLLAHAQVVAIGPTTASALRALGVRVSAVADEPTPAAFVDAVARAVRR